MYIIPESSLLIRNITQHSFYTSKTEGIGDMMIVISEMI